MQTYRRGDRGPAVAQIRATLHRLGLLPDGPGGDGFDDTVDHALRAFQQDRGLRIDGIVGPETLKALDEARWRLGDRALSYSVASPFVGDDVAALQHRLMQLGFDPGRCDGIFGTGTETALRDFQRNMGLVADGICGPKTLRALGRLARTVVGGSPERMREEIRLTQGGLSPAGKFVVLDPGHGGTDRGATGAGLTEADVVADIAARVEGRLGAIGVVAFLTHGPDSCPGEEERAAFANEAGADLLISLHIDADDNQACNGAASYFYGTVGPGGTPAGSAVGRRLAELVQQEIVARTDLLDCSSHPKTWTLLRLTRMPAVRLELGYLSHPGDANRLASGEFRDAVAEAIAAAVQRIYLPDERDVTTGQLRIPVLSG